MNDFFNRLFGKPVQTSAIHRHDTQISVQDESDNATRHQLVQMLLRGLVRKHGIPADWIDLKILVVPGKKQGLAMYMHLVLRQWDERMINHAQVFQSRLMAEIKRYDPKYSEWLHGVSWQLKMDSTCPYTTLPEKPFWTTPTQAAAAKIPVATATTATTATAAVAAAAAPAMPARSTPEPGEAAEHANLERLFAIRDQEMKTRAELGDPPSFEDTQPMEEEEEEAPKR
ncbi:MAG: hypothetical protein M3R45_02000 [Pseudomonadota bacterium]|nr:hypothetical protein [Pseudomonadota bacterium]